MPFSAVKATLKSDEGDPGVFLKIKQRNMAKLYRFMKMTSNKTNNSKQEGTTDNDQKMFFSQKTFVDFPTFEARKATLNLEASS